MCNVSKRIIIVTRTDLSEHVSLIFVRRKGVFVSRPMKIVVDTPCGAGDNSRVLSARETSHPRPPVVRPLSVLWVSLPDPLE